MRQAISDTAMVLRRALRFFLRRYPVILGFGLLASIQRFLAVSGSEQFAFAGGLPGEIFTGLVRLGFVVWLGITLVRPRQDSSESDGLATGLRSIGERPLLHVGWFVTLIILTLVFKVGIDAIGHTLPTADQRQTFLAWELAIKNLTIIPFTMVWVVTQIGELCYPTRTSVAAPAASRA